MSHVYRFRALVEPRSSRSTRPGRLTAGSSSSDGAGRIELATSLATSLATGVARTLLLFSAACVVALPALAAPLAVASPTQNEAAAPTPPATAAGSTAPAGPSQRKLLDDFLHYVRIARPDLASASGTALFDSGITDAELADLVDQNDLGGRVETVTQYGRGMEGVKELVAEFESRLERGRRDLSRDPERIRDAVKMLIGTRREQVLGQGRLSAAGEYAVPALLKQIVEGKDPQLELAATDMLVAIKRQAVPPLCAALPELDPASQRRVCEILGAIGWPNATPYLLALADDTSAPPDVRAAATQAFGASGGTVSNLSDQWAQLARRYFDGEQSLLAWPSEATNNVWGWDDFVGLVPTPVPTPIHPQVMAMKTATESLRVNNENAAALGLFVAANLRRENDLPAGETDPIFGASPFSPQFYATAAGTDTASGVLALGLAGFDTPLVRDAIAALRETAGAGNLVPGSGDAQPLVDALQYPDRRVQYEAAITLANGLPLQTFSGDFAVVPTLASAVRSIGSMYAVVVTPDSEDRQVITGRLQALGFTVLNPGPSIASIDADIAAAPGVDLVVLRGADSFVTQELATVRSNRKLVAAPVLAVASGVDKIKLDREFGNDRRVMVWPAGGSDEQFTAAVDQVMARTSGGRITEAESQQYAIEALGALQAIAQSGSSVFRVQDAQPALVEALAKRTGGIRLLVADVLALTPTDDAQRQLLDAALNATETEQVELLDRVAASARRFGNNAEPRQIDALLELINTSKDATADAAARAHGALNLPAANAVKLIVR